MNTSILLGGASLPEMSYKRRKERSETHDKFTFPSDTRKIIPYFTLEVIEVHHAHEGYELQGFKGQRNKATHTQTSLKHPARASL